MGFTQPHIHETFIVGFSDHHLDVPDALHAGRIDVGVVGRGDASSRLSKAAAATVHSPFQSDELGTHEFVRVRRAILNGRRSIFEFGAQNVS